MEIKTQPDKWPSTVGNCLTRCQSRHSFRNRIPDFQIYLVHTKIHDNTQMECSGATERNHFLVTISRDLERELRLDVHKSFLFFKTFSDQHCEPR